MAAGPSRAEALKLTYRVARRVVNALKREGGYLMGITLTRTSEDRAWCPSYLIESRHDAGGGEVVRVAKVVRLIRASNGEAAVITEDVT